ncbi:hypothetical protein C1645_732341 [Glomus cerebriforme]|uniref:Uncharacterized protein n=1 Tax=Glomus cerebriforme TaxID=658196 RepID=A0A397TJU5_9GLOM|nr:hypothetical protein C1645_732341 [Glomus cerebriforme]
MGESNLCNISFICNMYYEVIKDNKDNLNFPQKFLGHIKKVGSYIGSIIDIIECARKIKYKSQFSNIRLYRMNPVIINNQPIFSWKNIIKRFTNDNNYERFMDYCSKKSKVIEKIEKVYTDKATQQSQQLNGNDVKQCIYLHAEMNILTLIIDNKIKKREFIAVSKKCCYLCELYIDFARKCRYNIIISGNHKKIYSGWKLPHVTDNNFKIKSLIYILENLNQIIENKIKHHISSLRTDSNSSENNSDLINHNIVKSMEKVSLNFWLKKTREEIGKRLKKKQKMLV